MTRKRTLSIYNTVGIFYLFFLLCSSAKGADFVQTDSREGSQIGLTQPYNSGAPQSWIYSPYTVYDQFFLTPVPNNALRDIYITGALKINDRNRVNYTYNWRMDITYTIKLYSSTNVLVQTLSGEKISINYFKNANYEDYAEKIYRSGTSFHKAVVEITEIRTAALNNDGTVNTEGTPSSLSSLFKDISFEWKCTSVRNLKLDPTATVAVNHVSGTTVNPQPVCTGNTPDNIVRLAWGHLYGAESYDVEWLFLDIPPTAVNNAGITLPSVTQSFDFDWRNATRVNITGNFYDVPLLYPTGVVVYRVRPVGVDIDNNFVRLEGKWSRVPAGHAYLDNLSQVGNNDRFTYCGLERKLNWTATLTFAEEGKRKAVVAFVDGTGKSRQTITTLSTDKNTVVAEPSLDNMGRASVNFLPVALRGEHFGHFQHFNGGFGATVYDLESLFLSGVPAPGIPATAVSAVNTFYSPNNAIVNLTGIGTPTPYDQYLSRLTGRLPDAGGYPFTQTRIMNDGSGRPYSTSGVGNKHMLEGGHDTKYIYGTPGSQAELDRLFGAEAGFVSYYKKNLVTDPNGQVAVTYLDGYGRTVATALAGTNTGDQLFPVSEPPAPIKGDLLGNNKAYPNGTLVATKDFSVAVDNTVHSFSYTVTPAEYATLCTGTYGCAFEFLITLKDAEGTDQTPTNIPGYVHGQWQDASTATFPYQLDFTLGKGKYTVTKTLRIKQTAYETMVAAVNSSIGTDWENANACFVPPYESGCLDCNAQCSEAYRYTFVHAGQPYTIYRNLEGPGFEYTDNNTLADLLDANGNRLFKKPADIADIITQAESLILQCQNTCGAVPTLNTGSECEMKRVLLLRDLLPGGQYFENRPRDPEFTGIENNNYLTGAETNPANRNAWLSAYASGLLNDFNALLTPQAAPGALNWEYVRAHWSTINEAGPGFTALKEALVQLHPEYCIWKSFCENIGDTCTCKRTPSTYGSPVDYNDLINSVHSDQQAIDLFLFVPQGGDPTYWKSGAVQTASEYIPASFTGSWKDYCIMDPILANCGSEQAHDEAMNSRLQNYMQVPVNGGGTREISIWYIISDPEDLHLHDLTLGAHPDYPESFVQYMQVLHGSPQHPQGFLAPLNVTPLDGQISRWQYFRSTYTGLRMQLETQLAEARVGACLSAAHPLYNILQLCELGTPSAQYDCSKAPYLSGWDYDDDGYIDAMGGNSGLLKGMQVRYPYIGILSNPGAGGNGAGGTQDQVEELGEEYCTSNCSALATQWISQLQNGIRSCVTATASGTPSTTAFVFDDTQKQLLRSYFLNICNTSCMAEATLPNPTHDYTQYSGLNWSGYALGGTFNGGQPIQSIQDVVALFGENYPSLKGCPLIINTIPPIGGTAADIDDLSCRCNKISEFIYENDGLKPGYGLVNPLKWETVSNNPNTVFDFAHIAAALHTELGYDMYVPGDINHLVLYWMDRCNNSATATIEPLVMGSGTYPLPQGFTCPQPEDGFDSLGEMDCATLDQSQQTAVNSLAFKTFKDEQLAGFTDNYKNSCMESARTLETFTMSYTLNEYHYTLYYYDQAGNLVKTVPPAGVKIITSQSVLDGINTLRYAQHHQDGYADLPGFVRPAHTNVTNYVYNGQNQVVEQTTPDGGNSVFFYDQLGRLSLSRNAKQRTSAVYSYTLYDPLGRTVQVGEVPLTFVGNRRDIQRQVEAPAASSSYWRPFENMIFANYAQVTQMTATSYDVPAITTGGLPANSFTQENLRGRVASSFYYAVMPASFLLQNYDNATHYSYDVHGNVKRLAQDIPALQGAKRRLLFTDYVYDLISGKVNEAHFMKGYPEQWSHYYRYDADNRVTAALTSKNGGTVKELEAKYFYYPTGPVARVELGRAQVQGMDYAYSIHGWLKGVNADEINTRADIGQDGRYASGNLHGLFGVDAAGFTLSYYQGDYSPIGTVAQPFEAPVSAGSAMTGRMHPNATALPGWGLYNGNISKMVTAELNCDEVPMLVLGQSFAYDQLHRIRQSTVFHRANSADLQSAPTSFTWNGVNSSPRWRTAYTYNPDGDIMSLVRTGDNGNMDDLTYYYKNNGVNSHQLDYIKDGVLPDAYSVDIDSQTPDNYQYDPIGNLVKDRAEEIDVITWNVYGKVKSVQRTAGSFKTNQWFGYNPAGLRIVKINRAVNPASPGAGYTASFYALDAQGNVMAVYDYKPAPGSTASYTLTCTDQMIYGSSRLGTLHRDKKICDNCVTVGAVENSANSAVSGAQYQPAVAETLPDYRKASLGTREYEFTNHLSNVLATLADRKTYQTGDVLGTGQSALVFQYRPEVLSSGEYYPFGMKLTGRDCAKPVPCTTTTVITEEWVYTNIFPSVTVTMGTTATVTSSTCGGNPCLQVQTLKDKDAVEYPFSVAAGTHEIEFDVEITSATGRAGLMMTLYEYNPLTGKNGAVVTQYVDPPAGVQKLSLVADGSKHYKIVLSQYLSGTLAATWRRFGVKVVRETLTTNCPGETGNEVLVNENFNTPCETVYQENFGGACTSVMQENFTTNCTTHLAEENFTTSCTSQVSENFTYSCANVVPVQTFTGSYNTSMFVPYVSGALSINADRLQYTGGVGIQANLSTTVGQTYTVKLTYIPSGTNITYALLGSNAANSNTLTITNNGTYEYTFTASGTATQFYIAFAGSGTKTAFIDNFSVCNNAQNFSRFRTNGTVSALAYSLGLAVIGTGAANSGIDMMVNTTAGQTYTVKFDYGSDGQANKISGGGYTLAIPFNASSVEYTFTATVTGLTPISLILPAAGLATIDNYTVCQNTQNFSRYGSVGELNMLSFSNNKLTFAASSSAEMLKIQIPTTVNQTYTAKFDYAKVTSGITAVISATGGYSVSVTDDGNVQVTFKAVSTTSEIVIQLTGASGMLTASIDNFSVCRNTQDLSPYKPYGTVKDLRFTSDKLTFTTGVANNAGISIYVPTTAGETYTATLDYARVTPGTITSATLQAVTGLPVTLTADGTVTYTFTAGAGTQSELRLLLTGTTANKTATIDNLSICRQPSGYAKYQPTATYSAPPSYAGGRLTFNVTTNGTGVKMQLPTVAGKTYIATFDYGMLTTGTITSGTVSVPAITPIISQAVNGTSGTVSYQFTATATQTDLHFVLNGSAGTKTAWIDNVSLCKLPDAYAQFQPTSISAGLTYNGSNMTVTAVNNGTGMKVLVPTVPGEVYDVDLDYAKVSSNITTTTARADGSVITSMPVNGPAHFSFTATSALTELSFIPNGATGTKIFTVDNFRVQHNGQYSLSSKGYRYGYNGQEKDNEVYGQDNSYTAEFWQYDPRSGRRWNIDPASDLKPWMSPYHAFSDNPILNIDLNGAVDDNYHIYADGRVEVERTEDPINNYYYHDEDGTETKIATFNVSKNQTLVWEKEKVTLTAVKDVVDLTDVNLPFLQTKPIGSGNYFLDENVAAALLGAAYKFHKDQGVTTYLHQLNGELGGHSEHPSMGDRVDIQYVRTDGKKAQTHANKPGFDKTRSELFVTYLKLFGFKRFYTQDAPDSKQPALAGTEYSKKHYHHLHADMNDGTLEVKNYVKVQQTVEKQNQNSNNKKKDEKPGFWENIGKGVNDVINMFRTAVTPNF